MKIHPKQLKFNCILNYLNPPPPLPVRSIRDCSAVFLAFSLVFTNRSCNHVAHVLAKQVPDNARVGEWQSAPSCVLIC